MDRANDLIQVKGVRDGLLITMTGAGWEHLRAAMFAHIDGQREFFQGARIAVDVGETVLRVHEMVGFRDQLSDRGVSLWAVISESEVTRNTAQLLGLATRIAKPRPEETRQFAVEDLGEETALFLGRTLRSGTRVEFAGHVVILGDVNPGAEIIAEGSILVWGKVRGLLHAGGKSNTKALICALDLSGAQLRIAGHLAPDAGGQVQPAAPSTAGLDSDGEFLFTAWKSA
jgi:septum site-determining protein MinC